MPQKDDSNDDGRVRAGAPTDVLLWINKELAQVFSSEILYNVTNKNRGTIAGSSSKLILLLHFIMVIGLCTF